MFVFDASKLAVGIPRSVDPRPKPLVVTETKRMGRVLGASLRGCFCRSLGLILVSLLDGNTGALWYSVDLPMEDTVKVKKEQKAKSRKIERKNEKARNRAVGWVVG